MQGKTGKLTEDNIQKIKMMNSAICPPAHELLCPQRLHMGLAQTEILSTLEQPEKDKDE